MYLSDTRWMQAPRMMLEGPHGRGSIWDLIPVTLGAWTLWGAGCKHTEFAFLVGDREG